MNVWQCIHKLFPFYTHYTVPFLHHHSELLCNISYTATVYLYVNRKRALWLLLIYRFYHVADILFKGKTFGIQKEYSPGTLLFIIKSVEEPTDNLHFLYMGYLYTEVSHTIYVRRGTISAVYFMYKSRAFKAEPVNKLKKTGTGKSNGWNNDGFSDFTFVSLNTEALGISLW